ncbi:unnamed protein product, partial [Staurois parvus]
CAGVSSPSPSPYASFFLLPVCRKEGAGELVCGLWLCVQVSLYSSTLPEMMVSKQAFMFSLGSLYLSLLFVFLLMDVYARPANNSSLKEKPLDNKNENEILPPDHLNGVKLEMDGHLN